MLLQRAIGLRVFNLSVSECLFENPTSRIKKSGQDLRTAKQYTSRQFREFFRRETLTGLGIAINPSEYRHIAIRIARRFLRKNLQFQLDEPELDPDQNDENYEDNVINL